MAIFDSHSSIFFEVYSLQKILNHHQTVHMGWLECLCFWLSGRCFTSQILEFLMPVLVACLFIFFFHSRTGLTTQELDWQKTCHKHVAKIAYKSGKNTLNSKANNSWDSYGFVDSNQSPNVSLRNPEKMSASKEKTIHLEHSPLQVFWSVRRQKMRSCWGK